MPTMYNIALPQSIKSEYTQYDIIDWLVRVRAGNAIVPGSLKITGKVYVEATKLAGTSHITFEDQVFINPYGGAHCLFRSFISSVNDMSVESIGYYPRIKIMREMAKRTLDDLASSGECQAGLQSPANNFLLLGEANAISNPDYQWASFSITPDICLNKATLPLSGSRFPTMKISAQLASALEALYTTKNDGTILGLTYTLKDLQLHWREMPDVPSKDPLVLNTTFLTQQSVVSKQTNLNVLSPQPYDAVAVSFIRQVDRNKVDQDNNSCYFIDKLNRVEVSVNGFETPLQYPLTSYEDIALNYSKSLDTMKDKNSVTSVFGQQQLAFGVGSSFIQSVNDKVTFTMFIDDDATGNNDPSTTPLDAFMYINSYAVL